MLPDERLLCRWWALSLLSRPAVHRPCKRDTFSPLSGGFRRSQIVSFLCATWENFHSQSVESLIWDLVCCNIILFHGFHFHVVRMLISLCCQRATIFIFIPVKRSGTSSCLDSFPLSPPSPLIAWLISECDHGITILQRDTAKSVFGPEISCSQPISRYDGWMKDSARSQ